MSSQNPPAPSSRRVPQQERAERRVANLLEAAGTEFAAHGYDAATMTAIAERAQTSIGAVYQYFPNKEALARALRDAYGDAMETRWTELYEQAGGLTVQALVERIFALMVDFIASHPAYLVLLDAAVRYSRAQHARERLRERLGALLLERNPRLEREHAVQVASTALQIVKSMIPLYASAKPREREKIVREFEAALAAYLELRLLA